VKVEVTPDGHVVCGWFAGCENTTDKAAPHPVLGHVPCCDRCADLLEVEDRITFELVEGDAV